MYGQWLFFFFFFLEDFIPPTLQYYVDIVVSNFAMIG